MDCCLARHANAISGSNLNLDLFGSQWPKVNLLAYELALGRSGYPSVDQ
jgi:hypothetical protein